MKSNDSSVAEVTEAIAGRADVLSSAWPTTVVVLLAVVALLAWVASHVVRRRLALSFLRDLPPLVLRVAVGTISLWLVCSVLSRIGNFELATGWSLWTTSFVSAFCIEAILALYNLERQIVTRRMGLILVGLRTVMVLLLGLMLVQPVLSERIFENDERIVVVLLDESTSMDFIENNWDDAEKLRLVEALSPDLVKRPYQLDKTVPVLMPVREKLLAEAESLASLGGGAYTSRAEQYDMRAIPLRNLITEAEEAVAAESKKLEQALADEEHFDEATRTDLAPLHERLVGRVGNRLLEARQLLEGKTPGKDDAQGAVTSVPPIDTHLREAATELGVVLGQLAKLAKRIDHDFLASLSDEARQEIEAVAATSRSKIAQALLLGQGKDTNPGLIDLIADDYTVRVYLYSSDVAPVAVDEWKNQIAGGAENTVPDRPDAAGGKTNESQQPDPQGRRRQTTDLAGALARVRTDIPAERLSGVLVVSDGRFNGPDDPDAIVRQLAAEGTPVCTLTVGSSHSPLDAAIAGTDQPTSVLTDDRLDVEAVINVAGMKGHQVLVKLLDENKETTLDEKTVKVASDEMTKTVVLAHTPKETGLRNYHVVVEPLEPSDRENEAFAENNERTISVGVTDDRTHVLIVEGRPRWEFRYLRNLLADRDKSVRLQTVLIAPDQIAEMKRPPPVHASVERSRQKGKTEATLPPKNKEEWLKFDVIVLGDVPPRLLGGEILKTLNDFVSKQGGTLITIAGPNYMPHAYENSVLEQMLPILFRAATGPQLYGPEPQFRWALTATGRGHPIMKQPPGTGKEVDFWKSLPPFFWRHEIINSKPGATVLAYATTAADEREFGKTEGLDAKGREALLQKRKAFESRNALVVAQNYGIGRTLMLNTDRTWRLRYRVGDTYHHRFWGQLLRWAVSDKLRAGTSLVRLGTDQLLYAKGDPVIVRARITDKSFTPLIDEEAQVKIYKDDDLVLTKKLELVPDSNGRYEVNVGTLPGDEGVYRVELDSPRAKGLLASEGVSKLETHVTVLPPASQMTELIQLSADRTAMNELARHGGGQMLEVNEVSTLLDLLGPPSDPRSEKEPWRFRLWDTWPLMLLLFAVVTIEWILRKKAGLA